MTNVTGSVSGTLDMSSSIAMLIELGFKIPTVRRLTRTFSGTVEDVSLIKKANELPFITVEVEKVFVLNPYDSDGSENGCV